MLKNIDPADKSIRPFKTHKNFTLTQNSSGSGHYFLRAVSSSIYNFQTGSATSQSFGTYDYHNKKYSLGTYYDIPNYFMIKNRYYENDEPFRTFGGNTPEDEKIPIKDDDEIIISENDPTVETVKNNPVKGSILNKGKRIL